MSGFISGLGRVPNLLVTRTALNEINRTNVQLFQSSEQLSTGRDLLAPSQDPVRASLVSNLDASISDSTQQLKNLQLGETSLNALDQSLRDIGDLLEEAYSIGLGQIGAVSTASEREDQALVIDSIIEGVLRQANSTSSVGHIFGGSRPTTQPIARLGESFLFVGETGGLFTRATTGNDFPVTLGAGSAVGELSARVKGAVDLDPNLTPDTRLKDLGGATGLGIRGRELRFAVDGGDVRTINLDRADTIGDALDRITRAIRDYEDDTGATVLGTGGLTLAGETIALDLPAAQIEFFDVPGGVTALDLGLRRQPPLPIDATTPAGEPLNPKLTLRTPVAALAALTDPLGQIRIRHASQEAVIDLSAAANIGDIKSLIESAVPGVRVGINAQGTGIDVISELSGRPEDALSISEVPGQGRTASRLGIRSLDATTPLSDFNFGRGVSVLESDPDPRRNIDFTIIHRIEDGAGALLETLNIDIDLTSADLVDVQTLLGAINTQIDDALTTAGYDPARLDASLTEGRNGIAFTQDPSDQTPLVIDPRNNSLAAHGLGLLNTSYDPATNTVLAEDTAAVRAPSVFTHLRDLADALRSDDRLGMELATNSLKDVIDSVADQRALVGGYTTRARDEIRMTEDRQLVDETLKSEAQDLDFTAAASRFSLLQTQLQAGLQTAAVQNQLSLLNFI